MKKIPNIILFFVMLSCSSELNLTPTTTTSSDEAKKSLDLLTIGLYSQIGSGNGANGVGGENGALYSTDLLLDADLLASENYMQWTGSFSSYQEISNKVITPTNTSVTRMWRKGYATINQANIILESLENVPEGDRDGYRAQALFIRGIIHFELLRFWMEPSTNLGIPLMLKSTQEFTDVTSPARATIDEVYTSVIADITLAQSILPDADDVYATKLTAQAFLARIYLYKGDYANALTNANDVIESGNYSLPGSVEEAFNVNASPESIFEMQNNALNNAGTANDGLTTFYACDPNTPGGASRGDVAIDATFIDRYEPTDKRASVLIYEGTCNKGSITSGKWHDPYSNTVVMRLSEMYLIRAEANERLGSTTGDTPLSDVNAIRSKAGASLLATVTLDDILNERDLEFAFEGQRIHDYKRTAKEVAGVDENGDPVTIKYTDPQFIFPIPQTELNNNKSLVQNSFYK